jgi:hypothetical protein
MRAAPPSTYIENPVERILRLVDRELAVVPEPEQEETLRQAQREMHSWLQAIATGRERRQRNGDIQ